MTPEQLRIRSRAIKVNECWLWSLSIDAGGYGVVKFRKKQTLAHRMAYTVFKGEIPEGLHIDHLCRKRNCVNPDHLEAVTKYENTMRGFNPAAINARKTHCIRGHKFDKRNTYIDPKGKRSCRTCEKIWQKTYQDKKKLEFKK